MRNIWILFVGQGISGLYFCAPVLSLFLLYHGVSMTSILFLESARYIISILFEIPTGVFADRYGRKWSIVAGAFSSALSWIPWILADGRYSLYLLSYGLWGISSAFLSGATQAFMYEHLLSQGREKQMQKIYGMYLALGTLSYGIGSLIGGFFISDIDSTVVDKLFIYSAIPQCIGFIIFFFLADAPHQNNLKEEHLSSVHIMRYAITLVRTTPIFRSLLLLSVLTSPFVIALFYLSQPYLLLANIPLQWFGVIFFCSTVLTASAKVWSHTLERFFTHRHLLFLITVLPGIFWMMMGLVIHPIFSLLLFFSTDIAANIRDPLFADYFNRHTPSAIRATALSCVSFCDSLVIALLYPVVGFIATHYSVPIASIVIGVWILFWGMFLTFQNYHSRLLTDN